MPSSGLEDRFLFDITHVLDRPKGPYKENFVFISLLDVCLEIWSVIGLLGWCWGSLTGEIDEKVILDMMDVHGKPKGS